MKNLWLNIRNTIWMKVIMIGVPVAVVGGVTAGVVVHRNQVEETMNYQTAEQYETVRDAQSVETLEIASKMPNYAQILMMNSVEAKRLEYEIPNSDFNVEEVVVESVILTPEEEKKEDSPIVREPAVKPADTTPAFNQVTDVDPRWNGQPGWASISGNHCYYTNEGRRVCGDQVINGRHYYFNGNGALASYCGIDVSHHQGSINWSAVKADGIDYAIVRAGYRGYGTGVLAEDRNFSRNIHGAYNAGLDVGVYYFSQAVNVQEAQEEAYAVLTLIRREGVPITYPVIIDLEDAGTPSDPGRANANSPETRSQVAATFCQVIASAGYKPMVYGSKSYLQGRFAGLGSYGVWVAHYADMPRTNYSGSYQMWQYTSKGSVAGISGNVDMNICYVDYKYGRDLNSIGTYATAQVPDLSGKTAEEARAALDRVTLNCTLTEQYSDTVEAGKVVSQSIAPGTQVDERTTVEVVISKGKEPKVMINVVGSSQAEAVSALEALGLRVIINTENSDTVSAGCVVWQSVSAGTTLYAGDSVTLVISAGPAGRAPSEDGSSGSGGSEGTIVAPPASETGATGVSATVQ